MRKHVYKSIHRHTHTHNLMHTQNRTGNWLSKTKRNAMRWERAREPISIVVIVIVAVVVVLTNREKKRYAIWRRL